MSDPLVGPLFRSTAQQVVRGGGLFRAGPAHFNDVQRQTIKDAGQAAGLKCGASSTSPTATAMAYGVDAKNIDEVVLVGGMTRMPRIQQLVKDVFGKDPVEAHWAEAVNGPTSGHRGDSRFGNNGW